MKLSIIVPVYNAEQYLSRCLDSLLAQKVTEKEIICVNDGSTDSSAGILAEYEKKYDCIRVLTLTNGGQGRARNYALKIASGKYIGFTDSDDWVEEDMFSSMLRAAEKENADITVCDFLRDDGKNPVWEPACRQNHPLASAGAVWNKLFRRETLQGLRFPEGLWYEDFAFSALALMRSEKTVHVPEAFYHYRADNTSTMRNQNSEKNLDMLKIMEIIRTSMGDSDKEKDDFEFLLINNVLLDTINRLSRQETKERDKVIAKVRDYVHTEIPSLDHCTSYQSEARNRRVIMYLNYHGMEKLGKFVLDVRAKL